MKSSSVNYSPGNAANRISACALLSPVLRARDGIAKAFEIMAHIDFRLIAFFSCAVLGEVNRIRPGKLSGTDCSQLRHRFYDNLPLEHIG